MNSIVKLNIGNQFVKITQIICPLLLLFAGCKNGSPTVADDTHDHIGISNEFVDAFYSFNNDTLAAVLSDAKQSHPEILYYQKWAECGNYRIVTRHGCIEKNDSLILCPVTVKDDLMAALEIDFNVTDTFHVTIRGGRIRSVTTSSNDPEEYYQAKEWVKNNRPAYIEKQCEGIWEGGPTPCECIQGMIKGLGELAATRTN